MMCGDVILGGKQQSATTLLTLGATKKNLVIQL